MVAKDLVCHSAQRHAAYEMTKNPEDASNCELFVHENVANMIVVSLEWVGHRVTTDRHTLVGYKSIKHMIPCRPVLPHVQLLHVHTEEQHQAIGI
jgi:hypothetical protein